MTPDERKMALVTRIKDRLMDIEIGLFNALIASDALFIGAASVLFSIKPNAPKWLFFVVIVLCSISMLLLLVNFSTMRGVYRTILLTIDEASREPTVPNPKDAKYVAKVNEAADAHDNNAVRERICYALFAASLIIFGVVVAAY